MPSEGEQQLIKSRARVRDHGEVFTPDWLVRDMCDLVAGECARVESRFLEPACGNGNFMVEILRRKLAAAQSQTAGEAFCRAAMLALTSLYGVDIQLDNVLACRENLFKVWTEAHDERQKADARWADCERAARFVLDCNILHGNTLEPDGTEETPPIVFVEWSWQGDQVTGTEERLSTMILESVDDALLPVREGSNTIGPAPYWELGNLSHPSPTPSIVPPATPEPLPPPVRPNPAKSAELVGAGIVQDCLF